MTEVRRNTIFLIVAAFVPLAVLSVLLIAGAFYNLRVQAEQETLARAAGVNARIDGELMLERGSLAVLAGSQFIRSGDWPAARLRARDVQDLRPEWQNVILTNGADGEILFQTAPSDRLSREVMESSASFAATGEQAAIGGSAAALGECRCILLHQLIQTSENRYVLTVLRKVADLQRFLLDVVKAPEVGAVVDSEGSFVARTLDYEKRFGSPATDYVRNAVKRGGNGIYEGVTYENLRNQTAYVTSGVTGWSTHIAVPASRFALLGIGSLGSAILAVGLALLFVAGVTAYAIRDMRNRRLAERSALQAQKLEAIGHLSGTVAHDFNNLLAAMIACLRIVEREPVTDRQRRAIVEGLATADKGARLIRQLLDFAREKPLELRCVDLNALMDDSRELIRKCLGGQIELNILIDENARHVRTSRDQLELALLNLAANARDAMPTGGRFSITTRVSPGAVDLVVKDNGPGMPEKIAARVTEPYFTTKPEGQGTGLGLAQVQLLAVESGGSLQISTAPGKGAEFILRLPVCDPKV